MMVYFLMIPYLYITRRMHVFWHFMLASVVALTWMLLAKSQYGYNQEIISVWGINLFALFAWASGLFGVYLVFSHLEAKFPRESRYQKMGLFLVFYWPVLIGAETLFYHVFNLHNLASASYEGLPVCDCLHAPPWMQLSYFALGPIYYLLCHLFGLQRFTVEKTIHTKD